MTDDRCLMMTIMDDLYNNNGNNNSDNNYDNNDKNVDNDKNNKNYDNGCRWRWKLWLTMTLTQTKPTTTMEITRDKLAKMTRKQTKHVLKKFKNPKINDNSNNNE